jgi:hypothetical protein
METGASGDAGGMDDEGLWALGAGMFAFGAVVMVAFVMARFSLLLRPTA